MKVRSVTLELEVWEFLLDEIEQRAEDIDEKVLGVIATRIRSQLGITK